MRFILSAFVLLLSTGTVTANVVVSYWEVGGVAFAQSGAVIDFFEPDASYHEYVTEYDPKIISQFADQHSAPIYQTLDASADLAGDVWGPNVHFAAKAFSHTTYWLDIANGISWGGTMDFAEYHSPDTVVGDNFYNGQAWGSVNLWVRFQVFNADAYLTYGEDYFANTYEPGIFDDLSNLKLTDFTSGNVLWDTAVDGFNVTDLAIQPGEYLLSGSIGQISNGIPGTRTETYSRAVSLSVVPEVSSVALIGLAMSGAVVVELRQRSRIG